MSDPLHHEVPDLPGELPPVALAPVQHPRVPSRVQVRGRVVRRFGALTGLVLIAVVLGALATGESGGPLNLVIEVWSARSGRVLSSIGSLVPFGFPFVAGMVAAVNPCGFSLLFVYLGLFLRADPAAPVPVGLAHAGRVAGLVTAGFLVLFVGVGGSAVAGAHVVRPLLPWLGLGAGVVLVAVGAWILSGGTLFTAAPARLGARIGSAGERSVRGYVLFGVSYGIASLSCTLPIFLGVVTSAISSSGPLVALGRIILYGLGMGAVILALSLSLASLRTGLTAFLRRIQRQMDHAVAILTIAAGAYVVYYWLTLGRLDERLLP